MSRRALGALAWALVALLLLAAMAAAPAKAGCDAVVTLVDFGRLDPKKGGEITGELTVTCDQAAEFAVALSAGHGDYRLRRMRDPDGSELRYNLYIDPARRRVWGDGATAGTATIRGQSDGRKPVRFTVYGQVSPRQKVDAGDYRDNLLLTVKK
jgi:spore coat protein U-like protein